MLAQDSSTLLAHSLQTPKQRNPSKNRHWCVFPKIKELSQHKQVFSFFPHGLAGGSATKWGRVFPFLNLTRLVFFMTYRICFFRGWLIFFSSRCHWISQCLPSPGPAWKRLGGSGGTDSNVPVLVRGEQDGFYYQGTVKGELEVSDGCRVTGSNPHTPPELGFWFSWWDQGCLHSPVLVLGTEPGSASPVGLLLCVHTEPSTAQEKGLCFVYTRPAWVSHRPKAQGLSRNVSEGFNSLVC